MAFKVKYLKVNKGKSTGVVCPFSRSVGLLLFNLE